MFLPMLVAAIIRYLSFSREKWAASNDFRLEQLFIIYQSDSSSFEYRTIQLTSLQQKLFTFK